MEEHFGYNSFFMTKTAFSYCIQSNLIICYYRIKSNFHVNRGGIIPHLSTYCHNRLDIHQRHVFPDDSTLKDRILHPLEQYKFSLNWLNGSLCSGYSYSINRLLWSTASIVCAFGLNLMVIFIINESKLILWLNDFCLNKHSPMWCIEIAFVWPTV